MIGRPAAARPFTNRPAIAIVLSVIIALITVWAAIAISYQANWPIGFFVGTLSAFAYALGRTWAASRHIHTTHRSSEPEIALATT